MKAALVVLVSVAVGVLLGFLARGYILPGSAPDEGREEQSRATRPCGPASRNVTVRIEPASSQGDSREAFLVLARDSNTGQRWPLGSASPGPWSQVAVNRSAVGDTQAWWLHWRVGGGTGLSEEAGAVVWFPGKEDPAFWSGMWTRTESFLGPDAYDYEYCTRLLLRPGGESRVRLQVEVKGRGSSAGEVCANFLCTPRRMRDGTWRFFVEDEFRADVAKLLSISCLSGIHDRLKSLLGRSGDDLVAFWLQYRDGEEPVPITGSYAALMIWNDQERRFYLYDNVKKRTHKTDSFERFVEYVERLPRGARVQRLNSCGAPFAYAMPEADWQRVQEALRKRDCTWATNPVTDDKCFTICICETIGLRFP